jgi:hypothetical protein
VERTGAGAHALQGQAGHVHIHTAGLGFGQNGHHLTRLHVAQRESAGKGRKPFVFDAFNQHVCVSSDNSVYMKFHGNSSIMTLCDLLATPIRQLKSRL